MIEDIVAAAKGFYNENSDADKAALSRLRCSDGARGYQVPTPSAQYEAFDFFKENDPPEVDAAAGGVKAEPRAPGELLSGKNLWPKRPASLRETCETYTAAIKRLGMAITTAMAEALSLDDDERANMLWAMSRSYYQLRLSRYPQLDRTANGETYDTNFADHTDIGGFTFIIEDSRDALFVEDRGNHNSNSINGSGHDTKFTLANPVPDTLIVLVGDAMQCWTNALWRAITHRVVHDGVQDRFSVQFFFDPSFGALVKPLPSCVRQSGGTPKYDEYVYGDSLIELVKGYKS